nr:MAG TPA: holin [Caudoviricetes sp.]
MKVGLCTAFGVVGGCITSLFGGWDAGLITLVICMSIDYISGLSVAGIFHKSKKSEHGALESRAGFKGLCRKSMILFFVLISYRLDLMIGSNYIRDAVIIGFVVNELISIIENATLMDLPIPAVLKKAVDGLKREEE